MSTKETVKNVNLFFNLDLFGKDLKCLVVEDKIVVYKGIDKTSILIDNIYNVDTFKPTKFALSVEKRGGFDIVQVGRMFYPYAIAATVFNEMNS